VTHVPAERPAATGDEQAGLRLSISTGNAGMCEPRHVAEALSEIADAIESDRTDGRVLDRNGNQVGNWRVTF
jgi:hypothetical protein